MRGPEHVSVAVLTSAGALWLMNGHLDLSATALAAISATAIGALAPDIDHPQAWISNRIPAALIATGLSALGLYWYTRWSAQKDPSQMFGPVLTSIGDMIRPLVGWAWLTLAIGVVLLLISIAAAAVLEHRGPTHSLTAGVGLTLVATIVFAILGHPTVGLWFGWGYLTHLLTDMLTPMGCPALLWPWRLENRGAWDAMRTVTRQETALGAQVSAIPGSSTDSAGDPVHARPAENPQVRATVSLLQDAFTTIDPNSDGPGPE